MKADEKIRLFGLSHAALERELDSVESSLGIDLGRVEPDDKDEDYYPQFDQALRQEAAEMSKHYEVFYCLEASIRKLVAETLEAQHGKSWWNATVSQPIRDNAQGNMQRELDSGVTIRSEHEIDYTTFGELGEIVRNNWTSFGAIFSSQKAFTKIMTSLNTLRGPIAHCCPLAEDEVLRLRLTVKDWFRLME
ncbi:MAG: hypothetical protein K2Q17_09225 [Nitrospiraceae bacterium]|uniref:Swt1 family HEPN domain-containing protein n=1 Tax=Nitrospira cf. moscoviensis SBR1015 TaxID=96242 RepID=UPI000A0DC2CF|nr:Swt1 family HEPN domain-containing protein [Nitrospira cf. moscoviensis SBR1015]MBY0247836.1 hypothetical protein [Nitrospiraceae bacterium]OQW37201.1 MAG: hypothetical protein A4E20_05955 [Nitrospira sp. SG-bin2]